MINLLPDNTKNQLRAARTNSALIIYIIFLILSVIFLVTTIAASYMFLTTSKSNAEKIITTKQTKPDSYISVINQANELSQKFSTVKNILDQQVSYSDIIMGLGAAFPNGVIVNSLIISNTSIGTPILINARAKTSSDEATLKANFQKTKLFSNYNLKSLSSDPNDTTGYPVLINFEITINKNVAQ